MNKTRKTITIFIDESGTLPDPKTSVVIVAAVGTKVPSKLRKINQEVRKYLKMKKTPEIKFYTAGNRTRKAYLKAISKENIDIFTLTVKKSGKKIADSPSNFALLCWFLLEDCFNLYQNFIKEIVFDRHFHQKQDLEKFNRELQNLLNQKLKITHADSQKDTRVNSADMIAGSLLWAKTGKNDEFYQIIKDKVITEKVISWKNLRNRFFKEKISSNRRKRPSKRD